jgi:prepilin-type N-terminal cleavage/methylation domain-containing protein
MFFMQTNRRSGFTLIEMMISFFVISMAVVVYVISINAISALKDSQYQQAAFRIAQTKLGALRALGYDALPSSGAFSDSGLAKLPNGSGALAITVYNASTKKVVVTVSWTNPGIGNSRSVVLESLITKGGLGR